MKPNFSFHVTSNHRSYRYTTWCDHNWAFCSLVVHNFFLALQGRARYWFLSDTFLAILDLPTSSNKNKVPTYLCCFSSLQTSKMQNFKEKYKKVHTSKCIASRNLSKITFLIFSHYHNNNYKVKSRNNFHLQFSIWLSLMGETVVVLEMEKSLINQ
jgi:hypothetical protein